MSSTNNNPTEEKFRLAFERLKEGKPIIIPVGKPVTQNNVSREAGFTPSALKKARFPFLVEEIQAYIKTLEETVQVSNRTDKSRTRKTKQRLRDCQAQRDKLSSIVAAQQRHLEILQEQITRLNSRNVAEIFAAEPQDRSEGP